jgi:hypothetical protein
LVQRKKIEGDRATNKKYVRQWQDTIFIFVPIKLDKHRWSDDAQNEIGANGANDHVRHRQQERIRESISLKDKLIENHGRHVGHKPDLMQEQGQKIFFFVFFLGGCARVGLIVQRPGVEIFQFGTYQQPKIIMVDRFFKIISMIIDFGAIWDRAGFEQKNEVFGAKNQGGARQLPESSKRNLRSR